MIHRIRTSVGFLVDYLCSLDHLNRRSWRLGHEVSDTVTVDARWQGKKDSKAYLMYPGRKTNRMSRRFHIFYRILRLEYKLVWVGHGYE